MTRRSAPKAFLLAALASAALVVGGGVADAGDIKDTVRAALATNPEVGVVRADRYAVDQELRQARALNLPSIDLRAAIGPEYSNNTTTRGRADRGPGDSASDTLLRTESRLTLTQLLFDGFGTQSEIDRQLARVDSASYRVEESGEFIAADAIEAHLDVIRNEQIVELTVANIAAHENILSQVRQLEQSGAGGIADVVQTEARLAAAVASLADAEGNLADARATYQAVVGEAPSGLEDADAPTDVMPGSAEASAERASTSSPTVKIATSDVAVTVAELRGSRSDFYPQIDLELSTSANDNIDGAEAGSVDAQALVVLNYNLFRGGGDVAREREAFHRMNEARAVLRQARVDAERDARTTFNALERQGDRLAALVSQAEANRRTRDAYAQEFQLGQRSLLDVLDSENELFVSRVGVVSAEYAEKFAAYRLLAVMGGLLETLDIDAPSESIDIYRSPADASTPERIDAFSREILDQRAIPRPLRGEERGEAPVEPNENQVEASAGAGVETYASFDDLLDNVFGAPTQGAAAEPVWRHGESDYDSFQAYIEGAFGGGDAAPAQAAAPANIGDGPAEYENFDALLNDVFEGQAATTAAPVAVDPNQQEIDQLLDEVFSTTPAPSAGPEADEAQSTSDYPTFSAYVDALRKSFRWQ